MTKSSIILVIFLFACHVFASPWRPFGVFKRAPGNENRNHERARNFYATYEGWPSNSEIHGSQLSSLNTPSDTTTQGPLETSTTFPQYSWETTTVRASAITSSKIRTANKTIETHKTSMVNETFQQVCSVVPTSTIYKTIFGTTQRQTVLSTITEIQTLTGVGFTVTQQVPTTILSIVASQGSCTPVGPVIPSVTVTRKETTTIFSTIFGPTIVSTQVLSQTRPSTFPAAPSVTQTIVSTVKSVYTETEWSAATATVKSTYTETEIETTILPGQIVTRTQFSKFPGPTVTSIQYQVSTITLPIETHIATSTLYQGKTVTQTVVSTLSAITQIETYTCTETEFFTSLSPTTVYQTQVNTIVSTYTAWPFTTTIISTASEVQTITASMPCTQVAPVIPFSAATSTLTVTQAVSEQHITVTETGQQSCSAISPNIIWSTLISTVQMSCASPTNILTTILSCSSKPHETVTVGHFGNCTQASVMVTVTSTKEASCSTTSGQTKTVYNTIVSTVQASCASPTYISSTHLPSHSPSKETMTVTVSGSCTQAGPIIPSTTIIVTSTERPSCSAASAQTSTVYSTIISTAQASYEAQVSTQTSWITKIETQSELAVYPTPSTVTVIWTELETTTVVVPTTSSVGSQTSKEAEWSNSVSSQAAPPVYGVTSTSVW